MKFIIVQHEMLNDMSSREREREKERETVTLMYVQCTCTLYTNLMLHNMLDVEYCTHRIS